MQSEKVDDKQIDAVVMNKKYEQRMQKELHFYVTLWRDEQAMRLVVSDTLA